MQTFVNTSANYLVMLLVAQDPLVGYQTHIPGCSTVWYVCVMADGRKVLDDTYVVASLKYAAAYQVDPGHEELVYVVILTER